MRNDVITGVTGRYKMRKNELLETTNQEVAGSNPVRHARKTPIVYTVYRDREQ